MGDAAQLFVNPTLARQAGAGGWTWIRWGDDGEAHEMWAADGDELTAVIARAQRGATAAELAAVVDAPADEAAGFVEALVAAGVLATRVRIAKGARGAATAAPGVSRAGSAEQLAAFARRHGDVEVPLLAALEPEVGGGPLLDGLVLPARPAAIPAPVGAPRIDEEIVADVVFPGGAPPVHAHAIALAPVEPVAGVTWLAPDDLRVSIVGERLVLRSAATNRRVVPRVAQMGAAPLLDLLAALGDDAGAPAVARFPARELPVIFPLGSEWLDAKLYVSPRRADELLAELVAPFVDEAHVAAGVDAWHVIRYADPRWHLRLRLHGEPASLLREVLPALSDAAADWLADGRLEDLQVGTYRREVDRYGGAPGALVAERIFTVDSACVATLVALLSPDDDGEDARWRLAALGIEAIVGDLVDSAARPGVFTAMRDDFLRRFGIAAGSPEAAALAKHAARHAARLADTSDLGEGIALLGARSERLAPLVAELHAHEQAGRLSRPVAALAPSFAHMFANRMLRAHALEQELVLYELLAQRAATP